MKEYRVEDNGEEWGEDKEGTWWRRAKGEPEWTQSEEAP